MRPVLVVVPDKLAQRRPQVLLVQDDEVVETLSAYGPDHTLHDGVRTRCPNRRGDGVDTHASGPLAEVPAVDGIPLAEQVAWLVPPGCRLD
jgi:hypothetical protein